MELIPLYDGRTGRVAHRLPGRQPTLSTLNANMGTVATPPPAAAEPPFGPVPNRKALEGPQTVAVRLYATVAGHVVNTERPFGQVPNRRALEGVGTIAAHPPTAGEPPFGPVPNRKALEGQSPIESLLLQRLQKK